MANTFEDYTAISNQLDPSNAAYGFVFNFPYLEDTHVTVEVDGTPLSRLTTRFKRPLINAFLSLVVLPWDKRCVSDVTPTLIQTIPM